MLRINRLFNLKKNVRTYWTPNDYEQNINQKILLSLNEIKSKLDNIILSNSAIYFNIFENEIKNINLNIKNIKILLDKK